MHDIAINYKVVTEEAHKKTLKGCINILLRTFPLMFEDKELLMRCMWREQALFGNQLNAILMMESISLLLFKPGFTIQDVPAGLDLQYYAIDEQLVWRSGITIPDAPNHNVRTYDGVRIMLLRLLITILS
jgi:High-temperature-induced dauer-formation protein